MLFSSVNPKIPNVTFVSLQQRTATITTKSTKLLQLSKGAHHHCSQLSNYILHHFSTRSSQKVGRTPQFSKRHQCPVLNAKTKCLQSKTANLNITAACTLHIADLTTDYTSLFPILVSDNT